MLFHVTDTQAESILGAMRAVATANGSLPLSQMDSHCLAGAARFVFRLSGAGMPPLVSPEQLRNALDSQEDRASALNFLAVLALVDGRFDSARLDAAKTYATALGIDSIALDALVKSAEGHLKDVLACMMRQNILSISGKQMIGDDFMAFFLPYTGTAEDRALESRFEGLQTLPPGSLGRAYWEWYKANGFEFPGNPHGLSIEFALPHDSTHLLSGYDTSPHGELLVSTFTAGMHPHEPMEGHILPVIYSWHLNIRINDVATSSVGQFDPDHFFEAWERGSETTTDVFAPAWNFWAAAPIPLEEVRRAYGVPPASEAAAAMVTAAASS